MNITEYAKFFRIEGGVIYPPDFSVGTDPLENVTTLERIVLEKTGEPLNPPQHGKSREGLERIGFMYAHERRLLAALTGQAQSPAEAQILHDAVQDGHPINIAPLYFEKNLSKTFSPVLQKIGDKSWQLGAKAPGQRTMIIEEPTPEESVEKALRMVHQWHTDEQEKFQEFLRTKSKGMGYNPHVLFWALALKTKEETMLTPNTLLKRWGKHGTYLMIEMGKGYRAVEASSFDLAGKYAYILTSSDTRIAQPTPSDLIAAMGITGITPNAGKTAFTVEIDGKAHQVTVEKTDSGFKSALDGNSIEVRINQRKNTITSTNHGKSYRDFAWEDGEAWSNNTDLVRFAVAWTHYLITEKTKTR
jgi:hypothetical protein